MILFSGRRVLLVISLLFPVLYKSDRAAEIAEPPQYRALVRSLLIMKV